MNCLRCPYYGEIESFAAWRDGDHNTPSPITDERRKELFDICRDCGVRNSKRNGEGDTFSHKGQSQVTMVDGMRYTARAGYLESRTRDESKGCTLLDPKTEDALRIALSTVFSKFDPVEILLLRHIMSGATFSSFLAPLRELYDRLGRYNLAEKTTPGFNSLVNTWADRMKRKYPPVEGIFKAGRSATTAHAKGNAHKKNRLIAR